MRARHITNSTSKVDLTLSLTEVGGGLEGQLEYSTDLFDGSTVRRMLVHLEDACWKGWSRTRHVPSAEFRS